MDEIIAVNRFEYEVAPGFTEKLQRVIYLKIGPKGKEPTYFAMTATEARQIAQHLIEYADKADSYDPNAN